MKIHEISRHNTKFWVSEHVYADFSVQWFDQVQSENFSTQSVSTGGRQPVTRLLRLNTPMVLRHYYRGGLPARLSKDYFVFTGYLKSRCYLELTLLASMFEAGLPVPKPVAAKCQREGVVYKADILMEEIENAKTLLECLSRAELKQALWAKIGSTIKRFHEFGIQHVDLNANNILIDDEENIFLIDFDRCKQRQYSSTWAEQGLSRLARSLKKEKARISNLYYQENMFLTLRQGYEA